MPIYRHHGRVHFKRKEIAYTYEDKRKYTAAGGLDYYVASTMPFMHDYTLNRSRLVSCVRSFCTLHGLHLVLRLWSPLVKR